MSTSKDKIHQQAENLIDLDTARAQRPKLGGPTATPVVERVGVHYEAIFPGDLQFKLDHLVEHRDEFMGELTITYAPAGTIEGVLSWGKLNLLSITARNSLAKQLKEKVDADWNQFIDVFSREVVRQERLGTPAVQATEHQPRNAQQYLLDPILPMGLPTILYGPGGVGKSTLAAGIAFSVETGMEVIKGWAPYGSAPVLILDWEGRQEDWTERWEQVARGMHMENFPAFRYRACRRRLKDDIEYLADLIIRHHIVMVVVDSVSLAFGTSSYAEADPADMAIQGFGTMRDLGEVTWLLIDHVTGQSTESDNVAAKAYGSVKKRDLARQMFHVAGPIHGGSRRQELVVTHTKANYSARMSPIGLAIERGDNSLLFRKTSDLQDIDLMDKLSLTERILTVLGTGAKTPERLKELLSIAESDTKRRKQLTGEMKRLVAANRVNLLGSGEYGIAAAVDQVEMETGR